MSTITYRIDTVRNCNCYTLYDFYEPTGITQLISGCAVTGATSSCFCSYSMPTANVTYNMPSNITYWTSGSNFYNYTGALYDDGSVTITFNNLTLENLVNSSCKFSSIVTGSLYVMLNPRITAGLTPNTPIMYCGPLLPLGVSACNVNPNFTVNEISPITVGVTNPVSGVYEYTIGGLTSHAVSDLSMVSGMANYAPSGNFYKGGMSYYLVFRDVSGCMYNVIVNKDYKYDLLINSSYNCQTIGPTSEITFSYTILNNSILTIPSGTRWQLNHYHNSSITGTVATLQESSPIINIHSISGSAPVGTAPPLGTGLSLPGTVTQNTYQIDFVQDMFPGNVFTVNFKLIVSSCPVSINSALQVFPILAPSNSASYTSSVYTKIHNYSI